MKYITTILINLLAISIFAQTPSLKHSAPLYEVPPEDCGISTERLERIDVMIQKEIDHNVIPGAVCLVARNGKIVYHKAFGMADHESNRTFQTNDIFRIASQSKAITSTAVMMLWEHGLFGLDDPISRYIPEFKDPVVLDTVYPDGSYDVIPANKEISIRHLLTHSSGIGYGVIDGDSRIRKIYADAGIVDLYTTEEITIGENIKKLAKLPLHHHPGEGVTYSEGLDVLGYFIEIISGKPFDQYLRAHVFDPLGMNDTWFYLPESLHSRLVPVQTKEDDQWINFPVTFYDPDYPIKGAQTFFSGGAGLSSTLKDYATFLQMYLNKGEYNGVRLLSRTTVEFMMQNQIGDLWDNDRAHVGLAFGIVNENGEAMGGIGSEGTFNWGGYFNTSYFADPEEQVIGIIMKQTSRIGPDPTSGKFMQLVFQAIDD